MNFCLVKNYEQQQGENQFFRLYVREINFQCSLCICVLLFPQACRDFLDLAETHSRRWQRALQYEREQRTHLEETIEQLAKQHNSLERAWREAPTLVSSTPSATTTKKGETDWLCVTPVGLSVDLTLLSISHVTYTQYYRHSSCGRTTF